MTLFLDFFFFMIRYTPFWAIPLMMMSMQFGYMYWIKEVRWISYVLYSCAGVCGLFLAYYIYAGSPDNSARIFDDAIRAF